MPTCIIAIWIKPSISPSASKIRFFRVKILLSHTFTLTLQQKTHRYRDVAQLVSVRVWGACGRQFESGHPDKSKVKSLTASHLRLIKSSKIGEKSANGCLLIQRFSIGHFTQKFKKCLKKKYSKNKRTAMSKDATWKDRWSQEEERHNRKNLHCVHSWST